MNYFLSSSGDRIDITSDISVKMISPLFEKKNTYTYPITIPATPSVDIILGRARLIDSSDNKVRIIDGTLYIGKLYFVGTLRVNTTKKSEYSANFTGQNASCAKLNASNMDELDLGDASLDNFFTDTRTVYDDFIYQIDSQDAYCFPPYYNETFDENFPFEDRASHIVNYFHAPIYPPEDYRKVLPAFFVSWIIRKCFETIGVFTDRNDLASVDYKGMIMLSNFWNASWDFSEIEIERKINDIIVEGSTVTLSMAENLSVYFAGKPYVKIYGLSFANRNYEGRVIQISEVNTDEKTLVLDMEENSLISHWGNAGYLRLMDFVTSYDDTFAVNRHMPRVTFLEFLNQIETISGTVTIYDESKEMVRIVKLDDIITDPSYVDISGYAASISESTLNESEGYTIKFDTEAADEYFSGRVSELNENHTLKDAVSTLSGLPLVGNSNNDVRLVTALNEFYIWEEFNFGSSQINSSTAIYLGSWKFLSENFIAKFEGPPDIEISIKALPVLMHQGDYYVDNRIVPRIDVPMNTSFTTEYSDAGVRLLFFGSLTDGYPLASFENNYLKLSPDGTNGIYEKLYKHWIEWQLNRAREATVIINWPVRMLNSFKWESKYRIQNTNYLVKEINFKTGKNGRFFFGETILVRT